jgi:predicted acylesterase/phospholipase RssA
MNKASSSAFSIKAKRKAFSNHTNNILEYRYIEPENIRNRYEKSTDHLHLAFRGGGAKGVAYIGAYKAIKDLYPNAFIRSIIGSSAGGMIALAVSAGASTDELIDICKRMDQIPKDRTIKTM